jgi:hypothetical protein
MGREHDVRASREPAARPDRSNSRTRRVATAQELKSGNACDVGNTEGDAGCTEGHGKAVGRTVWTMRRSVTGPFRGQRRV